MKHIEHLISTQNLEGGKSILHYSVSFEDIQINEQKFGSKHSVQLFQYRRY